MVNEDKKYRVIGWNCVVQEWFVSNMMTREEALDCFHFMNTINFYTQMNVVQSLTVTAKLVYTLE